MFVEKKGTETGASDLKFCFIFQVGTQIWRRQIHKISALCNSLMLVDIAISAQSCVQKSLTNNKKGKAKERGRKEGIDPVSIC